MKRSKSWRSVHEKIDTDKRYSLLEAAAELKGLAYAKFDETVDLAVRLGVDPRKSDQMVRGSVVLPGGIGKAVTVAVFARGEKAEEAKAAGADIVGAEDLAEKIKGGFLDFDSVIATPDMMGVVGVLGRVLGPRGLMPNPKVGTVTMNVAETVKEAKAGRVEFRTEKAGIVHVPVGKISFEPETLVQNVKAVLAELKALKPSSAKGAYMKSVVLSSTMGPGLRIDLNELI